MVVCWPAVGDVGHGPGKPVRLKARREWTWSAVVVIRLAAHPLLQCCSARLLNRDSSFHVPVVFWDDFVKQGGLQPYEISVLLHLQVGHGLSLVCLRSHL